MLTYDRQVHFQLEVSLLLWMSRLVCLVLLVCCKNMCPANSPQTTKSCALLVWVRTSPSTHLAKSRTMLIRKKATQARLDLSRRNKNRQQLAAATRFPSSFSCGRMTTATPTLELTSLPLNGELVPCPPFSFFRALRPLLRVLFRTVPSRGVSRTTACRP